MFKNLLKISKVNEITLWVALGIEFTEED